MAAKRVVLYSFSLLVLFGKNTLRILRRHLVWEVYISYDGICHIPGLRTVEEESSYVCFEYIVLFS